MKKIALALGTIISTVVVRAQSFDEWFNQKETQIKYLVEQIAAFKAYGQVVKQGYDISEKGLTNTFKTKAGDYKLHKDFFVSLWKVKNSVATYNKVVSVLELKASIEKQCQALNSKPIEFLSGEEINYIKEIYSGLLKQCNDLCGELKMIVANDLLQLKDDERIQRIDKIYLQMKDCCQFSQSLLTDVRLLVSNRMKETNSIKRLQTLHGLK